MTMTVTKLPSKHAIAIERLIKARFQLPPCKFCGDDLADFMLPRNYMHGAYYVFCGACGKWSGSELDARVINDFVEAFAQTKHLAHTATIELLGSVKQCGDKQLSGSDERIRAFSTMLEKPWGCNINMWLITYTGLPQSVSLTSNAGTSRAEALLYDWEIMPLLAAALNQAVIARLRSTPEFDLDSQYLCKNCGASPSQQTMQNFNEVLREGDIHCGACDVFIRSWDPN